MTTYAQTAIPIGFVKQESQPVAFGEEMQRLHSLTLTINDHDRNAMQAAILAGHIKARLADETNQSITIIDPMGEISPALLDRLDEVEQQAVKWLDFSDAEHAPKLNMLTPGAFTNRDDCLDAIVAGLRTYSDTWSTRHAETAQTLLELGYDYNAHQPDPAGKLSVADALRLANDVDRIWAGRSEHTTPKERFAEVIAQCTDPDVVRAAGRFMEYPPATQSDMAAPLIKATQRMARECLDGESVISAREHDPNSVPDIAGGGVTVINTGRRRMRHPAASLLAQWAIALFDHVIRLEDRPSSRHLLACDGFNLMRGLPWQRLLAESHKYGGTLRISDAALPSNDHTAAAFLANCHTIMAGHLNQVDAGRMALEMPGTEVSDFTACPPREFTMTARTLTTVVSPFRVVIPHSE